MAKNTKTKTPVKAGVEIPVIVAAVVAVGAGGYVLLQDQPKDDVMTTLSLTPNNQVVVAEGQKVYAQNCASCHCVNLEGQANWRQRCDKGYMPAPPHDQTGHTWHHPDSYLFLMTKYGIEQTIGQTYPNNMPAYQDTLSDDQILAALSYIKSTWPRRIQFQHDRINANANAPTNAQMNAEG